MELKEEDRAEIARLINDGFTSGILYPENRGKIYWNLITDVEVEEEKK